MLTKLSRFDVIANVKENRLRFIFKLIVFKKQKNTQNALNVKISQKYSMLIERHFILAF